MVYYLKYRPQKIADLDLPEVKEGLEKLVNRRQIPHALLFTGPRGSGKTSAARIIAKAANCLKNKGRGEPCDRCEICQAIKNGHFIDLLEIDGASNRGIDDVRSLRENIKLAPSRGRFKVYIIDEVHMLTVEAFNALLKTLEEPPEHVLFVLCTTQAAKLPETIISRCVRFNFRKAKPAEVKSALEKVVKGEKLKVEAGVLDLLAGKVDGSFRDAQKILDQLATEDKRITLTEAKRVLGQIESFSPLSLISYLAARDVKKGLLEVERLVEAGADLKLYLQDFLETLRLILLRRIGIGEAEESLETKNLDFSDLKRLMKVFSQAAKDLKLSIIPQLPLELAVIEWSQTGQPLSDSSEMRGTDKESLTEHLNPEKTGQENGQGKLELKKIQELWLDLLSQVRPLNHSVSALLKACQPFKVNGDILTLKVFYQFHKERLETNKCRQIVEEAATGLLGTPVKIKCVLGEKEKEATSPQGAAKREPLSSSDIVSAAEEIFAGKLET